MNLRDRLRRWWAGPPCTCPHPEVTDDCEVHRCRCVAVMDGFGWYADDTGCPQHGY